VWFVVAATPGREKKVLSEPKKKKKEKKKKLPLFFRHVSTLVATHPSAK